MKNSRRFLTIAQAATLALLLFGCSDAEKTPAPAQTNPSPGTPVSTESNVSRTTELEINKQYGVTLDGKERKIEIIIIQDSQVSDQRVVLSIDSGDQTEKYPLTEGYIKKVYMYEDGKGSAALAISADLASDDYVTSVFDLSGGKPSQTCEADGMITGMSGTKAVLNTTVLALGTWGAKREYELNGDFELEPTGDGLYTITSSTDLAAKKDVKVQISDGGNYQDEYLPAGTHITLTYTDGKSFVLFKLPDGTQGRINYTLKDWLCHIDGVEDSELFDNIIYAG